MLKDETSAMDKEDRARFEEFAHDLVPERALEINEQGHYADPVIKIMCISWLDGYLNGLRYSAGLK